MKAAFQHQFGSPAVLFVQDIPAPIVKRNEILVEVHASTVTEGDRRLRAADYPGVSAIVGRLLFGVFRPRYPTTGTNFAGRVVAVGYEVSHFKVGDEVFGSCERGACAEYLAVAEDSPVARMPAGVSFEEAAAVPYGAGSALSFLRDVAQVQAGEKVLIVGASGGVGRFAVQVAKHLGARVTAVCSERKMAMVTELGADEVLDYRAEDYLSGRAHYDVIFDTHSGDGFSRAKSALSPQGRFVTVYLNFLVMLQMLASSFGRGPRIKSSVVLGSQSLLRDVADLLAKRAIWPVVAHCFPLVQIRAAHEALEASDTQGTVVVAISHSQKAA